MTIDVFLDRLANVKESGKGYVSLCPAHNDHRRSLSISSTDDKILLYCHAECTVEKIVAALGLEMKDLFLNPKVNDTKRKNGRPEIVETYPYTDEHGELLYEVVRYDNKDFLVRRPKETGGWHWNLKDARRVIYRLPSVIASPTVFICEGERDVETLEKCGETATCCPLGAGKWRTEYNQYFEGKTVIILPDNDPPGQDHAKSVAGNLHGIAKEIVIINLPRLPPKGDVTDFFENGGTVDDLIGEIERAEPWSPADDALATQGESGTTGLLQIKTAYEWMNEARDRPIPRKLFGEFWYETELCFLFADTGLGKSTLAVQIANSIASGVPVKPFDLEAGSQPVLYLDFELSDKQFELRYSEVQLGNRHAENHYKFPDKLYRAEINPECQMREEFDSFNDFLFECIEDALDTTGAKVLIVDNITYLRDELERSKDALPLMKRLKRLKRDREMSILALGHTPKRDLRRPITRNDLSGSKMIMNFTDSCFAIGESSNETGIRYLKQIKVRNASMKFGQSSVCTLQLQKQSNFLSFAFIDYESENIHLKVTDGSDREENIRKVKELSGGGYTQREISEKLGIGLGTVSNYLRK